MSRSSLLPSDQPMVLALAEAMQTSPSGIVSRAVLQTAELRVVLFTFADGQELTTHTSTRRALVQILDGACEFEYAGRRERLDSGRLLHLPPNHPHAVRAAYGSFSMLLTLGSQPDEIQTNDTSSS